jgi:hypothetical protein
MPITPFHFGPGALLRAIAPRRVSFIAFCAANGVVDLEPAYYMFTGQFPLHRFMHTLTGATVGWLVVLAAFVSMRRLDRWLRLPDLFQWKALAPLSVAIGAALGTYSHLLLDGIMHGDMFPFAPISDSNPLLGAISLEALHASCVAAGAAGLALLWLRQRRRQRDD